MFASLITTTLLVGSVLGGCPNPDTKADLDPTQYLGTWYQVRGLVDFQPEGTQCVRAIYSAGGKHTKT